jgi:hypothetical protein
LPRAAQPLSAKTRAPAREQVARGVNLGHHVGILANVLAVRPVASEHYPVFPEDAPELFEPFAIEVRISRDPSVNPLVLAKALQVLAKVAFAGVQEADGSNEDRIGPDSRAVVAKGKTASAVRNSRRLRTVSMPASLSVSPFSP